MQKNLEKGRPNNLRARGELQENCREKAGNEKQVHAHNLDENQKLLGFQKLRSVNCNLTVQKEGN